MDTVARLSSLTWQQPLTGCSVATYIRVQTSADQRGVAPNSDLSTARGCRAHGGLALAPACSKRALNMPIRVPTLKPAVNIRRPLIRVPTEGIDFHVRRRKGIR